MSSGVSVICRPSNSSPTGYTRTVFATSRRGRWNVHSHYLGGWSSYYACVCDCNVYDVSLGLVYSSAIRAIVEGLIKCCCLFYLTPSWPGA